MGLASWGTLHMSFLSLSLSFTTSRPMTLAVPEVGLS